MGLIRLQIPGGTESGQTRWPGWQKRRGFWDTETHPEGSGTAHTPKPRNDFRKIQAAWMWTHLAGLPCLSLTPWEADRKGSTRAHYLQTPSVQTPRGRESRSSLTFWWQGLWGRGGGGGAAAGLHSCQPNAIKEIRLWHLSAHKAMAWPPSKYCRDTRKH